MRRGEFPAGATYLKQDQFPGYSKNKFNYDILKTMKKGTIIAIVVVLVLIGGGLIYWHAAQSPAYAPPASYVAPSSTTVGGAQATSSPGGFLPDATSSAQAVSTVAPNGDENPYGVAFVPTGVPSGGMLNPGDVLVSNWNDSKNLQGAGTTIVRITPAGQQSLFFQGKKPMGLTTALAILKSGFVIVGNLPTTDGTIATAKAGSLLVLDSKGNIQATLTDPNLIDGPWDMAVNDNGAEVQAFVSNVLSGTVVRFDLGFNSSGLTSHKGTIIASGYTHRGDPNAAVVGPTGLSYDVKSDSLFVAATADNTIFSIANAVSATSSVGKGAAVYGDSKYLHGPLGIVRAPNGDLLVANGDAINADPAQQSELVEVTPAGKFIKELSLDGAPGGAFGLDVYVSANTARLAAVDDNVPNLLVWTMPLSL